LVAFAVSPTLDCININAATSQIIHDAVIPDRNIPVYPSHTRSVHQKSSKAKALCARYLCPDHKPDTCINLYKKLLFTKTIHRSSPWLSRRSPIIIPRRSCYSPRKSMDLMGFKREEMIDYPNLTFCGVAKFLEEAQSSKIQLFI
ncbi:MAG: DsrE/DsrF/DrsH-like family protein, partial [Deltaproteobacteria bacterium]|nr:DsrE/DsrF/DrsH-like family protein [Deltaproteobacteria bacterium]MBW1935839.1 DsrE/DsrF/DrsH-like family protein [Deltaproteobacteria bacterium]